MKKLYCIKDLILGEEKALTKGAIYPIMDENDIEYHIIDDMGDTHYFTKHKDDNGVSYLNWFSLKSEDVEDTRLKLIVYKNDNFEEEEALVDLTNKEILLHGDYYHEKISFLIDGFLSGLEHAEIEYELFEEEVIDESHEWFNKIGFQA